ncbi:MAG TPA: DNA repair and recombination protein RadB [Methanocorpusculum sp.]|nr:DNA repair and recombination protein RadB [Methanocorpusculum sp.]
MAEELIHKISTTVEGFDRLLGGGLEPKMITQLVGEAGSGKSTLCLVAAVSVLRAGFDVIYIDSEGFSSERFSQIAGIDTEECAKHIYIKEPMTFAEQGRLIAECESLLRARNVHLFVVDSMTALYRLEQLDTKDALSMLSHQVMLLLALSKRFDVPVMITNQVFMDVEHHQLRGLGGTALAHISKTILRIEKRDGFRRAVVIKHRSQPDGVYWDFLITSNGVTDR